MERNRLFWASRRGMLELDLILLPFLENEYFGLAGDDQLRYQKLLDSEDQDLFRWLLHREQPEDVDLQRIVRLIRESRRKPD